MSVLERDDIQGIILRGYEEMFAACFVLLHIDKVDNFREFLRQTPVRNAAQKPLRVRKDNCINIAFTRPGLEKLDMPRDVFRYVSREFHEGMLGHPDGLKEEADPISREDALRVQHRQRMLGDLGHSAPGQWQWGNVAYEFDEDDRDTGTSTEFWSLSEFRPVTKAPQLHALLMLYAPDLEALRELYQRLAGDGQGFDHAFGLNGLSGAQPGESSDTEAGNDFEAHGVRVLRVLSTRLLDGRKEHFGFRDGIGQPVIDGEHAGTRADPDNVVKPGEFLFGYRNEYGRYPIAPRVEGCKDFGRNGSFLVFRQLTQDVPGFWSYLRADAEERFGNRANPDMPREWVLKLASKMVGRWPSGAPLVLAPEEDRPALEDEDVFGYFDTDRGGHRCPFGSHVRRSNPRDAFPEADDRSAHLSRRHRIIRRARAFGEPVPEFIKDKGYSIDPMLDWSAFNSKFDTSTGSEGPKYIARGLNFICFNANIARQFEFIQSTWIMNPKFSGLSADPDPVCGEHGEQAAGSNIQDEGGQFRAAWQGGTFTQQGEPACRRMYGMRRYVHVRGGGYFFMPGLRALRHLAGDS